MVDVTANNPMLRIGQKIVEISEDMRQVIQDASESLADSNLNTALDKVTEGGKMLLGLTKALEQINKAYLLYGKVIASN